MGRPGYSIMALASIFNFFMPVSLAIDPNCDYYQDMVMGQQYYIYNSEYPSAYGPSTSCRWMAYSPVGTKIVIACEDIDLPSSQNCNQDRLAISLTGNSNFADSKNYCGKGSLTLITESNAISIGLFSTSVSTGGRFVCTLTAIQDTPTTTTQRPNVCDCGWKNGLRIVGGQETGINEYPSMAGLIDTVSVSLFCGASIISDRYVLTAAHCVYNRDVATFAVLVGDHNISSSTDTSAAALYGANSYVIHDGYQQSSQINDIAIVRTNKAIVFSVFVGPVCLPYRFTTNSFNGQIVTALGWGTLEFSGPSSDTLQEVNLDVIDSGTCQAELVDNVVTQNQICTYTRDKDSCQKDSGGPLLWTDTSTRRLQLVGVISYGVGCATLNPSVNTRVTAYLTWIISNTPDANYCIK